MFRILLFITLLLVINCTNGEFKLRSKPRLQGPLNHNRFAAGPIIKTENGLVRGFTRTTIEGRKLSSFRAIPYGLPPIGRLRFQPPQNSLPWNGIRDATRETPDCIQLVEFGEIETGVSTVHGQEDCLYLEVHVPHVAPTNVFTVSNDSKPLPVVVFIHGGGFVEGSGSLYGPYYLLDQNVIFVTMNYRLGPFGFLSTGNSAAYGNAGLKDQVLALKWIRENIHNFHGDPYSVTIVGHSVGAAMVNHHILSPASRGLFHRAISHSGSATCLWAVDKNVPVLAYRTGSLFGCHGNPEELVGCLQRVPPEKLVRASKILKLWSIFPLINFAPVIEPKHPGAFLSQDPTEIYMQGKAANVPWINGVTTDEVSSIFSYFYKFKKASAELNSNWDIFGPIILALTNSTNFTPSKSEIATRIRDFYLGKENPKIVFANRHGVVQMLSDRYFTNCALDGLFLHARYTSSPTYAYRFSFKGKYSMVQLYGEDPKNWGVGHFDDILHLFNNTEFYATIQKESDQDDYEMEKIITSTWANFATFGIPWIGECGISDMSCTQKTIWRPINNVIDKRFRNRAIRFGHDVSGFEFLDLNLTPKMIANPFVERYEFLNSFHI